MKVLGLFSFILLVSCGDGYYLNSHLRKVESCTVTKENGITTINCPDGTSVQVSDGKDGQNGEDGKDSVTLYQTQVDKNKCVQVYPNIYVENINNGEIFDVYSNDSCSDTLGEYCDNVKASYGSSGQGGSDKKGSGEVCSIDKLQITGQRDKNDNSLTINVFDFN